MKPILRTRARGLLGVLLFGALLVGVNALVAGLPWRADLTEEHLYTLSAGTKQLLAGLDRPVVLTFYATTGDQVPIPVRQYAKRIEDLLREYVLHGGGNVKLEVEDPQPDSDAEEWAQKFGLQAAPMALLGGGPDLYLGLAAVSGPRDASIPFLSPDAEPQLEYLVTRLVHEVSLAARPKVGLLSSLPVTGRPPATPFGPPQGGGKPWAAVEELKKLYEVVEVEPGAETIPEEVTALVIIHPRDLSGKTLFAIDQFVLQGGRLLAFVDPACLAQMESEAQNPYRNMMGMSSSSSDLNRLTSAWGLRLDAERMAADPMAATPVRSGEGRVKRNASWLSLRGENVDRGDVAISGLEFLMLPFAGAFEGGPAEGLTMTPLLFTSKEAGLTETMQVMLPGAASAPPPAAGKALPVAVRLTGLFKTAFPEGAPAEPPAGGEGDEGASGETEKPEPPAGDVLAAGTAPGVVVLVADVDLLYDRFAVEPVNFFGYQGYQMANDNIGFLLNMVEQLAGSEVLIGLRSRGTYDRPFTRVLEIEQQAAARWRREEQRLQARLDETRRRLEELQASRDPGQKLILTDEQRAEIEQFRDEQFRTQRELKNVRKDMRRDIERLGWLLKLVNMAAVPVLVAAFGLYHGAARRRRAGG